MDAIECFFTSVEQCLGGGTPPGRLAHDEAERTVGAVLEALSTHPATAHDLTARVAAKLEVDEPTAERRLSCVVHSLRELLAPERCSVLPTLRESG